jgi:glycosyltransferase involved in cell wall biosynthesis
LSAVVRAAVDVTPLLGAPTGVGTFVRGLLTTLRLRPDLSLVGFGLTGRGAIHGAVPEGIETGRTFPAAAALRAWGLGLGWPRAEWFSGPIAVVHGTNFVVPPARRSAEVVTVHDLTAVRFPELCTPTARRYPNLVRRAVARGAWVHTPSTFVADEVREVFGTDRIRPVAHGVDRIDGDPARGRKLAGWPRYVLALGTVEPRKDLPRLVRAFDAVAASDGDVALVIAGPDGWGAERLSDAIRNSSHADRIVRLGYVGGSDRDGLLAGATVFAYPSVYEGFGLPVLEAMTAGTPVVATATGGVTEVVGEAAVTVPPGDEDAFGHALASLLADDAARAELAARGRVHAGAFTWARCGEGMASLYREAAGCA